MISPTTSPDTPYSSLECSLKGRYSGCTMIGKLHVWRGEQKKEALPLAQDRIRVRGSASFDDLDLTWKDALSSRAGGIAPIKKVNTIDRVRLSPLPVTRIASHRIESHSTTLY